MQVKDINIKKDLIKKIGQAKQCQLCKKLFSSEYKAIAHVHEEHKNIQLEAVKHLVGKSRDSKKGVKKVLNRV